VNYKRVERLYQEAKLQVRRRKRKKVPVGERQPLLRPMAANEVWSMDFVFDCTAEGRVIKCLTIVDDATHEAVAIEVERAISGHMLTRVLDRLALSRGLPSVIRTDNGKEFCGRAMVTWAHKRGVQLRLIEPGKPQPERLRRILQRPAARRVPQRALVHPPAARTGRHRDLAARIQRGASEEGAGWHDASGLCTTLGKHRYDQPRALNPTTTESGGTSVSINRLNSLSLSVITDFISRYRLYSLRSQSIRKHRAAYSTVTDLARLRGWSTSVPRSTAT
jgi:hypothetical protein